MPIGELHSFQITKCSVELLYINTYVITDHKKRRLLLTQKQTEGMDNESSEPVFSNIFSLVCGFGTCKLKILIPIAAQGPKPDL